MKFGRLLYLIEILHQTTTQSTVDRNAAGCILSKFYIKPQRLAREGYASTVVSYRNSTSNHNTSWARCSATPLYLIEILHQTTTVFLLLGQFWRLYLIEILHQTTTLSRYLFRMRWLYLIEILHQTTTTGVSPAAAEKLYLIEILHQTTTFRIRFQSSRRCILSKFYIKPQLLNFPDSSDCVVSYRNSTSNHNYPSIPPCFFELYLIEILHQTTTINRAAVKNGRLYLIEILHQTTTTECTTVERCCCILSKFYIKPQHRGRCYATNSVVSYRNSTSNHN